LSHPVYLQEVKRTSANIMDAADD